MYLPTFWKLTTEAYGYKMRHLAGWGLPATLFGKSTVHHDSLAIGILIKKENSVFTDRGESGFAKIIVSTSL